MYLNRRVQVPNRCAGPAQKDKEDNATDKMGTERAFTLFYAALGQRDNRYSIILKYCGIPSSREDFFPLVYRIERYTYQYTNKKSL